MYTKQVLQKSFQDIMSSVYQGVPGVALFDSGKLGPTVGITIHTHGNEPSGLAVYQHLMDTNIAASLTRGRILVVLNNPVATEKFFAADTAEAEQATRFIDRNMNRLPEDLDDGATRDLYEVVRARELRAVWQEFDVAIDIHSTTQDTLPMLIVCEPVPAYLLKKFPVPILLSNIHNIQLGRPAMSFYGPPKARIPVFGIESGQHTKPESFVRAVFCIQALLENCSVVAPKCDTLPTATEITEYHINGSLIVPDRSYELVRVFTSFEFVAAGTVLATNGRNTITMPRDGHTILGPKTTKIMNPTEEVLFFSEPKRTILTT